MRAVVALLAIVSAASSIANANETCDIQYDQGYYHVAKEGQGPFTGHRLSLEVTIQILQDARRSRVCSHSNLAPCDIRFARGFYSIARSNAPFSYPTWSLDETLQKILDLQGMNLCSQPTAVDCDVQYDTATGTYQVTREGKPMQNSTLTSSVAYNALSLLTGMGFCK